MNPRNPDACAFVVDPSSKRVFEITATVLTNQITRDAERIAKSFDDLKGEHVKEISKLFAHSFGVLTSGMISASREEDELKLTCGQLLSNSLNSVASCAYLVRGGFVLQPGVIIRSCIETIAVVLHLLQFQDDLKTYRDNKFDSTRAISSAKNVFPPYGKMYGFLSKEFTHIGALHRQLTPIREYSRGDEHLDLNMQLIASAAWMCYVACELAFLDVVATPRYWSEASGPAPGVSAYTYNPSAEELVWMGWFLNLDEPLE